MKFNTPLLTETEAVQRRASDPQSSAFVRANAGSGKTHVLTRRVLRLLLAGAPPAKILCLTFTKAAAANMAARVFDALSHWTGLDDAGLRAQIIKTGAPAPDAAGLRRARVLFAQTVETPGGLKIQTIHAFCERLLHLFPFEANVPASFEQADDARAEAMLAAAQRQCLTHAADNPALTASLKIVAANASQSGFAKVLRGGLKQREALRGLLRDHAEPGGYAAFLAQRLGLPRALAPGDVLEEIVNGGIERRLWKTMAQRFEDGSANDKKRGRSFVKASEAADTETAAELYMGCFFNKTDNKPAGGLVTNALHAIHPGLREKLAAEQTRLIALAGTLNAAQTLERSVALMQVLGDIIARYERMKAYAGLLDFDDLIARALALLTRSDAAWVLYKLDAGIDHILVDEAQDTSPRQWKILQAISADFLSGAGARGEARSFFAVGDEKQSIFSFQGAAPAEFNAQRRYYKDALQQVGRFADERLENSFRSAAAVIQSVDTVFSIQENYNGLSSGDDSKPTVHQSIKLGLPGVVELWPVTAPQKLEEATGWRIPDEAQSAGDPAAQLAERIAALVKSWRSPQSPERVADAEGRPRRIDAGDVMILVRRRNAFFEAMIRALKQADVPVAGADRLRILQHISVEDIVAAASVTLLPQDDLTLAAVLKSPLIGLGEDDLFTLAAERGGSLWQSLLLHAAAQPKLAKAASVIAGWRAAAALPPYDFFAQILSADGGRRRLLARLGPEAEDAIDEFLGYALDWQQQNTASLALFTASLADAELEIKRDLEAAGGAVRVMTVHGAKGLEAKIVFLPDTCAKPDGHQDTPLFEVGEPPALAWALSKKDDCAALAGARELRSAARDDEYRRLLYVALTRSEERLYIAGYTGTKGRANGSWHEMVERSLGPSLAEAPAPWNGGETILRRVDSWPEGTGQGEAGAAAAQTARAPLPAWLKAPPPPEARGTAALRPSQALERGADAPATGPRARAMLRGSLIHTLLQHLPQLARDNRRAAALAFVAQRQPQMPTAAAAALVGEALAVIDFPGAAELFGPQSAAEAAVAGYVQLAPGLTLPVSGQLDRLAVTPDAVLYADFKTGAPQSGDAPAAYAVQLALYGAVLAQLYPGRVLRAFIVWTAGPRVEEIAPQALSAAMASHAAAQDDVTAPAP